MGLSLQEVKTGLLDAIKALGIAADVRLFPVNKTHDEKFLDLLPDLQAKTVLLVQRTFADRGGKRSVYFSALLVFTDPQGAGDAEMDPAVERFINEIVGAELLRNALWVSPECDCANVGVEPQRAIAEISFQAVYELDRAVT